jgi:hypothetical protein
MPDSLTVVGVPRLTVYSVFHLGRNWSERDPSSRLLVKLVLHVLPLELKCYYLLEQKSMISMFL